MYQFIIHSCLISWLFILVSITLFLLVKITLFLRFIVWFISFFCQRSQVWFWSVVVKFASEPNSERGTARFGPIRKSPISVCVIDQKKLMLWQKKQNKTFVYPKKNPIFSMNYIKIATVDPKKNIKIATLVFKKQIKYHRYKIWIVFLGKKIQKWWICRYNPLLILK